MSNVPLLVFDTNVLLDVLLRRDGEHAALLVELAERGRVELVVPEYVLRELRGTALRWIRDERERTEDVRRSAKGWKRCYDLGVAAEDVQRAAAAIVVQLARLESQVDDVIERLGKTARIPIHTPEVHLRGEMRYLEGRPPDRPGAGLTDCRIYEALLDVARERAASTNPKKFFVTRDSDFDKPELVAELQELGFMIRKDPGRLYGELK